MHQKTLFKIIRKNVPKHLSRDIYHDLLTMSWSKTIALFIAFFLLTNSTFATLYWLSPQSLTNSDGSWITAFFFSVQTLGTIGYGHLAPATDFANFLVTIESALGLIIIAIMTGFFFAKFSRAVAKIDFTDHIVVTEFEGRPTLIFRMINIRKNQILDSTVHMNLLKETVTKEGISMRRFLDLKLQRSNVPIFALSMNMMHVIDETSPLWGMGPEACHRSTEEIIVTAIGTDGTFGQTIHASHLYRVRDILWNKKFKDMVTVFPDGTREVDYAHFNSVI